MGNSSSARLMLCICPELEQLEQVYHLPERSQLKHQALRALFDIQSSSNVERSRMLATLRILRESLVHRDPDIHFIKAHPHLMPPICMDRFNDDAMRELNQLMESYIKPGIFIHHLKILREGKYLTITQQNWPEGVKFRTTYGSLVKAITMSYKISPDILSALEYTLNEYFPNLIAFALDLTLYLSHPWEFPSVDLVENARFKTLPSLRRLSFKAHSPAMYEDVHFTSFAKLIAKVINSCVNIKYLNLDLCHYRFYPCLWEEIKLIPSSANLLKVQTLVIFHTILRRDFNPSPRRPEVDMRVSEQTNRFTDFLTLFSRSLKNLYLKNDVKWSSWMDYDRIPRIPKMIKVKKLCVSANSPLTSALTILQSFPELKTLILMCNVEHDFMETCKCNESEFMPVALNTSTSPAPTAVNPTVTLLAIERTIVNQPQMWLSMITLSFPNLKSLTFTLQVPTFRNSVLGIDQAEFVNNVALLILSLRNLQTLRMVLKTIEVLDFGDPNNLGSLYHAFKAFLNNPNLRHLVIDFGPRDQQRVPEYFAVFLRAENPNVCLTRIDVLHTPDFSTVRNFSHVAHCRKIFSDNSLGYYLSDSE